MKRYSLMTAVLALITALALTLGGCPNLNDDPPIEVGGLTAAPGGGNVTLSWTDPGGTYTAVEITLSPAAGGVTQPITVARGTATRRISGLANGTPYTFTVKLVYAMGFKSPGVTVMAIPGDDDSASTPTIPTIPAPVVKTDLQAAITAANAVKNGTADSLYWVKTADLTTFEAAITAAKTVYDNAAADQAAVDSETNALGTATSTFTTTHKKNAGETNPVTALTAIKTAKTGGLTTEVTIIVSGTINDTSTPGDYAWLSISGINAYPPIVLQGTEAAGGGTLNVATLSPTNKKTVLRITDNNTVTLGANLTLTGGGTSSSGGGVYVGGGTFNMTGGAISGNTSTLSGGGVSVTSGTFNMSGGTISGNTAGTTGGGVYVGNGVTFTKIGGTINGGGITVPPDNKATTGVNGHKGHAVYWDKTGTEKKVDDTLGPSANPKTSDASDSLWVSAPTS